MDNYNAPDLNAPRYRKKSLSFSNAKFFKEFKEKYPAYKDLDNKVLKEIIAHFNGLIWENVIEEREGMSLPQSLGFLFIGSCTAKKAFNADHTKSAKLGVKVKNLNYDTDNKLCKIVYTNYANKYAFKYREIWGFQAVRQFKRNVSKVYSENWQKYIVLDEFITIAQLFRKNDEKMYSKKHEEKLLEEYDEFEID